MYERKLSPAQTAENVQALGIDASKGLLVAGESAGADLALVVAGQFMNEGLSPPLTGVYAALPSCVTEGDVPQKYKEHFFSREQNADAPMLKAESMDFVDSTLIPHLLWDPVLTHRRHLQARQEVPMGHPPSSQESGQVPTHIPPSMWSGPRARLCHCFGGHTQ